MTLLNLLATIDSTRDIFPPVQRRNPRFSTAKPSIFFLELAENPLKLSPIPFFRYTLKKIKYILTSSKGALGRKAEKDAKDNISSRGRELFP